MRTVTIQQPITRDDLRAMATRGFGDMVKVVVDIERGLMIVDAEMHADQEAELLETGSRQENLWGINLYPDLPDPDWLEYDSMINLRPSFGAPYGIGRPLVLMTSCSQRSRWQW